MSEIQVATNEPNVITDMQRITTKGILSFFSLCFVLFFVALVIIKLFLKTDLETFENHFGTGYYMVPITLLSLFLYKPLLVILTDEITYIKQTQLTDLYRLFFFLLLTKVCTIIYFSFDGLAIFITSPLRQGVFSFISAVILAPLWEETVFRAILFKFLNQRLHIVLAILISSGVFSLGHPDHIFPSFMAGIALCIVYYKSNIGCSILLHSLFNFLSSILHYHVGLTHIEGPITSSLFYSVTHFMI